MRRAAAKATHCPLVTCVLYIERQIALANLHQTQEDTRGVRATDLLTGKLIRSVCLPLPVGNAHRVGCCQKNRPTPTNRKPWEQREIQVQAQGRRAQLKKHINPYLSIQMILQSPGGKGQEMHVGLAAAKKFAQHQPTGNHGNKGRFRYRHKAGEHN
jgi:hypothetical protein